MISICYENEWISTTEKQREKTRISIISDETLGPTFNFCPMISLFVGSLPYNLNSFRSSSVMDCRDKTGMT